jgi:polar amino acid transport system substrate-binding protein
MIDRHACFRRCAVRTLALALVLTALLVSVATPAWGLTNTEVTTRNNIGDPSITYGGQASRFTFNASTAETETVDAMVFDFPKGTDLSKARMEVVTLAGLARRPVQVTQQVKGESVELAFTPAVQAKSNMVVRFFDVKPPVEGGSYELKGSAVHPDGSAEPFAVEFEVRTLSTVFRITNWLNEQPFVQKWNTVPFFALFLNPQIIVRAIPLAFLGWLLSIGLVAVAFPSAIPFGLALAFMKMSKVAPVRWIANAYVNVIRGTPLFLQIYIAFFALPLAGIKVPNFPLGVVVLALNSSAYLAEIFRAGIQSISKGQFEAAASLGMTYPQQMGYVIIPQTVRRVLPTMTSEFILLFKDTALLSAVGVFELMKMSSGLSANTGNVTPYMVAAVYYLVLTIPLINWVGGLEAKLALSEGAQGAVAKEKGRGWASRLFGRGGTVPAELADQKEA